MQAMISKAPPTIENSEGAPNFGTFKGLIQSVDLKRLRAPHALGLARRLLRHKRWLYSFISTRELTFMCAVVHAKYATNAFALAIERRTGRILFDKGFLGVPGPTTKVSNYSGEGLKVFFRAPLAHFNISRNVGTKRYSYDISIGPMGRALRVKGALVAEESDEALSVVSPVAIGGVVNVTQKWAPLQATGTLESNGSFYYLDGGVGGIDYTNGYLARHTSWRWAFGCGVDAQHGNIAFNLVEGFNSDRDDVNENAFWYQGRLYPLARARFEYNPNDVIAPWKVTTVDGKFQMTFAAQAAHREERNLWLVKSHFVQPVGHFSGFVELDGKKISIDGLPGVTEDQDVLW